MKNLGFGMMRLPVLSGPTDFDYKQLNEMVGKAKKLPVEPWSRDIQEKALPWQPNFRHSILCRRSR